MGIRVGVKGGSRSSGIATFVVGVGVVVTSLHAFEHVRVGVSASRASVNPHASVRGIVSILPPSASSLTTPRIPIRIHELPQGRIAHRHAGVVKGLSVEIVSRRASSLTQVVDIIFELTIPTGRLTSVIVGRSISPRGTGLDASVVDRVGEIRSRAVVQAFAVVLGSRFMGVLFICAMRGALFDERVSVLVGGVSALSDTRS